MTTDGKTLAKKIAYAVDGTEGTVEVSIPVAPLRLALPGRRALVTGEAFVSGRTAPGAFVTIGTTKLTADKEGVFKGKVTVTEATLTVVAFGGKFAPRAATVSGIVVAKDLAEAQKALKAEAKTKLDDVVKAPDASAGKLVSGRVKILTTLEEDGRGVAIAETVCAKAGDEAPCPSCACSCPPARSCRRTTWSTWSAWSCARCRSTRASPPPPDERLNRGETVIDLDEAQALILANVRALGAERVPARAAMGRVLARDLHAREALPALESLGDGRVRNRADTKGEERTVLEESRAGGPTPPALARGTAMRIFTGAPTPVGTQAVVMQENVSREGDRLVIRELPKAGANIRARGVDVAEGALCIPRGTRLGPRRPCRCSSPWASRSRRWSAGQS